VSFSLSLGEIADHIGAILIGDSNKSVMGISSLEKATKDQLSFYSRKIFLSDLQSTSAAAIIISEKDSSLFKGNLLVMEDPYLGYAKVSKLFKLFYKDQVALGISKSAEVHQTSKVSSSASVGSFCVVGKGSVISDGVIIGSGTIIGSNVKVGPNSLIYPNSSLYSDIELGEDVIVHSGAVIGSDGLGFAKEEQNWVKVEHLGDVIIGNRVEIGSNSSIDRGSLGSTKISSDVKIDNLVHLAHNVTIGEHSAIAANSAVAGSTSIGKRCTIAGCCGIVDNIQIVDDVHITAMTLVTKSIKTAGIYSSGTPLMKNKEWKKSAIKFKNLYKTLNDQ